MYVHYVILISLFHDSAFFETLRVHGLILRRLQENYESAMLVTLRAPQKRTRHRQSR